MTAATLVAAARDFLAQHPPFSAMPPDELDALASRLRLAYWSAGEQLLAPGSRPDAMYIVRQGVVERESGDGGRDVAAQMAAGETFPLAALLSDGGAAAGHRAVTDVFCWLLPREDFDALVARSVAFGDYCRRGLTVLLEQSRRELQASYAQRAMQWRTLDAPVGSVMRTPAISVAPDTSLRTAFETMERERVGSLIVVGEGEGRQRVRGILTRYDVIPRVVLPQRAPDATRIEDVMSTPVATLDADASVADAMLLMAERAIRHVPVMRGGRLAGIVSERDLFALQRQSLRGLGDTIRSAASIEELAAAAEAIRRWSYGIVAQGVGADFGTRLISHLNDQLTVRLLALVAEERGVDLARACWIAMGSEGRHEQTIATDQDNGLILADDANGERERWLAFGAAANEALARCGFPKCRGGIMAGNPRWCLPLADWRGVFARWIERGDAQSLLEAGIFFDLRPLAGHAPLAERLREHIGALAAATPRFIKQMSDNALGNAPPASWFGSAIERWLRGDSQRVDLKMHGTVPFVDAARVLALAHGIGETSTILRLQALADRDIAAGDDVAGWIEAFGFIQGLRLRAQQRHVGDATPNVIELAELSRLDRRILKEAFRQARLLQQRLALDFPGRTS